MAITTLLSGLPARTMTQEAFDAATAQLMTDLPVWGGEVNATAASMSAMEAAVSSVAAGGAMSIPYTFSTTITDADPGAGFLRLSSATQNAATVIRVDLTGADASLWTAVLDVFDDSTSTIKGHILLQKQTDATKWLLFSVSSLASPAGYKNITVVNVASSAASPFANNDPLILKFSRNGDKGDVGAPGSVGDHAVVVHTGNGQGSSSTAIRRFTTAMINVGTAITYADSATLGATFTINENGMYAIYYQDISLTSTAWQIAISLNSAELTTAPANLAVASRLAAAWNQSAAANGVGTGCVAQLVAGNVIRPHCLALTSAVNHNYFSIRKVAP